MKKAAEVELSINWEWCKGCGICVAFCPQQVLQLNHREKSEVVRAEACIACMLCEIRCPDLAIQVTKPQTRAEKTT